MLHEEGLTNAEPFTGEGDPSAQGGEGPAACTSKDSRCADDTGEDDVDASEKQSSDSDNGEDIEFANIDVDHSKYSIQYCYDVFAALTPNQLIGQDNVESVPDDTQKAPEFQQRVRSLGEPQAHKPAERLSEFSRTSL